MNIGILLTAASILLEGGCALSLSALFDITQGFFALVLERPQQSGA